MPGTLVALLFISQLGNRRTAQKFNWDEPSKREDLRVRRQGIANRMWASPGTGLRDVLAYNELKHPRVDTAKGTGGGQPVLRCNKSQGLHHKCTNPIQMRTGLRICSGGGGSTLGVHDLIQHKDGRHMAEVVEELRFVQVIVPAIIGRAKLEGRSTVVMIELGAAWAYYCALFASMARLAGLRSVNVMIEPMQKSLVEGQANFALNGFCAPDVGPDEVDATWARALVCDSPEQHSRGSTAFYDRLKQGGACTNVAALMRERDLAHADVLWADLQGAELEALRGAPLQRISHVHLATHGRKIHNASLNLLREAGFFVEYHLPAHDKYFGMNDGYIHAFK